MYHYVYILESESDPELHYTGLTDDLQARLQRHNTRQVAHTSKHVPWRLRVAIAFTDRSKAADFERYLKSHSGRAFAIKHF